MNNNEPPPGSPEAIAKRCSCPRMDNANGRGYLGGVKDADGNTVYVYSAACPLHGNAIVNTLFEAIGANKKGDE